MNCFQAIIFIDDSQYTSHNELVYCFLSSFAGIKNDSYFLSTDYARPDNLDAKTVLIVGLGSRGRSLFARERAPSSQTVYR